jgi:hypothetical protein
MKSNVFSFRKMEFVPKKRSKFINFPINIQYIHICILIIIYPMNQSYVKVETYDLILWISSVWNKFVVKFSVRSDSHFINDCHKAISITWYHAIILINSKNKFIRCVTSLLIILVVNIFDIFPSAILCSNPLIIVFTSHSTKFESTLAFSLHPKPNPCLYLLISFLI